jgi:CHASE1-domain containing sensor protein
MDRQPSHPRNSGKPVPLAGHKVVDRITSRVDQHLSLLTATHSFFSANDGEVSSASFAAFVSGLDIKGQYDGIQGIGYADFLPAGGELSAQRRLKSEYGIERSVWPAATEQAYRTPIVLLEPHDPRNDAALGYDMFSEARRREAMRLAIEGDAATATASAPVELAQEITSVKQAGFLVYKPHFANGSNDADGEKPVGFAYAPFSAGDLHAAALKKLPILAVVLRTYDVTSGTPELLYESPAFNESLAPDAMVFIREDEIAGRKWRFEVSSTGSVVEYADFLPVYALAAVLVGLAGSLAVGTRWQQKAVESAVALHEASRRSLEEKELLLQEMRYRIKNSIARVMAIARQTAANSDTLEAFSKSFSARMNAMANAQDLLARSHWGRASLADLLKTELDQVFGEQLGQSRVDGPSIDLNERATQAFSLVFHELATNALKYSGVADGKSELSVRWSYQGTGEGRSLVLVWSERGNTVTAEPDIKGFGSRLVAASVRGELRGEIERRFDGDGMTVTFTIPAGSIE